MLTTIKFIFEQLPPQVAEDIAEDILQFLENKDLLALVEISDEPEPKLTAEEKAVLDAAEVDYE